MDTPGNGDSLRLLMSASSRTDYLARRSPKLIPSKQKYHGIFGIHGKMIQALFLFRDKSNLVYSLRRMFDDIVAML